MTLMMLGTLLLASASAQNITGTVTNGTTGRPAAGQEVTLLSLSQGMQEIGSTKTDAQGHFSFPAPQDAQAPHMVRVTHQGVSYFPQGGPLMPGSTTAAVTIFDAGPKVDGLSQTVDVERLQSDGKQLQGINLYAITNQSQPPRTLANDKGTFEIVLPEGAEIESAQARGPGGQPIAAEANPGSQKNHYLLSYPLRPGETQFQVAYHMPYAGEASLSPKALRDVQHMVVMIPKSMSFTAKDPQQFRAMNDPQIADASTTVMVATNVKAGEELSYRVSGEGAFQPEGQGGAPSGAMGGSQGAANDNRPGGGLGAPIDAPDPLFRYRIPILGVFAVVLVMGGAYIVSRSNRPQPAVAGRAPAVDMPVAGGRDRQSLLLEAMKEELFQLELDRQQGKVSAEEYAKAKAALDETIKRALTRGKA
jgi:carboxypeptidase family protein